MGKRTVFNGRFQIKETTVGFNRGTTISYDNGNGAEDLSLEDFATRVMEKIDCVDNINKPGGPRIKIIVQTED